MILRSREVAGRSRFRRYAVLPAMNRRVTTARVAGGGVGGCGRVAGSRDSGGRGSGGWVAADVEVGCTVRRFAHAGPSPWRPRSALQPPARSHLGGDFRGGHFEITSHKCEMSDKSRRLCLDLSGDASDVCTSLPGAVLDVAA